MSSISVLAIELHNELDISSISAISDTSSSHTETTTDQTSEHTLLQHQSNMIGDLNTTILHLKLKQAQQDRIYDNKTKALEKRLATIKEDRLCENHLAFGELESAKKHRLTDSDDHQRDIKKIRKEHEITIDMINEKHQTERNILLQRAIKAETDADIFRRLLTMENKTTFSSSSFSSSRSASSSSSSSYISPLSSHNSSGYFAHARPPLPLLYLLLLLLPLLFFITSMLLTVILLL